MLILTTNRYQSHLPEHGAAVRTTVGKPKFPLPYDLAGHLREVTPDGTWLRLPWPVYVVRYRARLDDLGLPGFLAAAERIAESAGTQRLDLLCFCGDPGECHRGLLRAWLLEHGLEVAELSPAQQPPLTLF